MRQVCTRFGSHVVHADLDLDVRCGEIFAIVGGSGSGKSTLLREMIMLHRPDSGSIKILDTDVLTISPEKRIFCGSAGASCSSTAACSAPSTLATMSVCRCVNTPILMTRLIDEVAAWKITLSGLAAGDRTAVSD